VTNDKPTKVSARTCVVKADEGLVGVDDIAFSDKNVLDDSAFKVLDDLVLASRYEKTIGNDSSRYRCGVCPNPKTGYDKCNCRITCRFMDFG
jgi:hypothetical protein